MKTFTHDGRKPRVTWEDASQPHQIRLSISGPKIAVSCSCRGRSNTPHVPLASADVFGPGQAMAIWRAHVAEAAQEHTA
jgi:hypothetical protein